MNSATTSLRERLRIIATDYEPGSILRATVEEAIAALSTPPAGEWVLVPREPTPEMREAGRAAHHEAEQAVEAGGEGFTRFGLRATRAAHVYAAMLAAAPEPATQEVG